MTNQQISQKSSNSPQDKYIQSTQYPLLSELLNGTEEISFRWGFDEQQADAIHKNCTTEKIKEELRKILIQVEEKENTMSKPTWDQTFMSLAGVIALRSDDQRTKVGCCIVDPTNTIVSLGYNGAPRGVSNEHVHNNKTKYPWVEHADRNAIYNAGRAGVPLIGCTMYLPWCPCADCARAIIQSGIIEVVLQSDEVRDTWADSCEIAYQMLHEAGVKVRWPKNKSHLGSFEKLITCLTIIKESKDQKSDD